MGSYANATIFAHEPAWKGLESLPFAVSAYRHRRKPVWVVAVFEQATRKKPSTVFTERAPLNWAESDKTRQAFAPQVRSVLARLTDIQKTTKPFSGFLADYHACLSFAAEMARRATVPAYFFAASDEGFDVGCYVSPERFERFAFVCDGFVIDYRDDVLHLAQRHDFDDDDVDVEALTERLQRCSRIERVVLRPLTKEDRRRVDGLYGFASALFPKEMMPAKTALKIGEIDMFDNLETDLQLVAERKANEASPLAIRSLERKAARPRSANAEKVELGRGQPELIYRDGDLLVFRTVTKLAETLFVDASAWPPKLHRLNERVWSLGRAREGRWVMWTVFREEPIQVGHRQLFRSEVRLRNEPFSSEFSSLVCGGPNSELGVQWVGMLANRVVADPYDGSGTIERYPLLQSGSTLLPVEGASLAKQICPPHVVLLPDGSDVLLWDNGGYELQADRLVKTFDLGSAPVASQAVPWGQDSFFFLEGGKLLAAQRGQTPRRHAEWLENIGSVTAGPPGTLLLHEYYDWNKELGEIYFPEDGSVIHLDLSLVKGEKPQNFRSLHWLPSWDRLLAVAQGCLWTLPAEFVLSLPRVRPQREI